LARGLPSWAFWSDLGGFARELAGLNIYCLLLSFPGFAVRKKIQKCLYLGHVAEFEREKSFTGQVKTEEHAGGMPRHARHEWSVGV
jgi:hypothetical protein